MTTTNNNIALVHRKEWQMMTPCPSPSATGSFMITDSAGINNVSMYVVSSTVQYLYHHDEDAWVQIPSAALAGTFGAGACGAISRWSSTLTASGGSTTTATTTSAISGLCIGNKIRFLSGINIGKEATVTGVIINPGGTNTIQFTALPGVVSNTDTFVIDTGRFFVLGAGTLATGSFKSYDPLLGIWTSLAIASLPASIGTDGKLVITPSYDSIASGTATSSTTTVLTNTPKTWTVNQWTNYQIRITSGTGMGQIRTISSNTSNTLTVSVAFTITPDATSQYEITGNEDYIYFLGNNAVAMYRYSISGNTWTLLAPGVARTGSPGVGMTADWASKLADVNWADESNIKNGRFIYSFRGGGTATLDRYDISTNAWSNVVYIAPIEGFGTGTSSALSGNYIYLRKDATHRFFKYSLRGNYMEPLSTNLYPDSTAVLGNKMWIKHYTESGVIKLSWLYSIRNSGTELHRMLLY